ncbi:MAG: HEAT repeat domain-containing protein [Planctomycetaceae bacterium]
MSIPVLVQVHDEVRRLAIAGSNLAIGDFRLKKLIAPLEQSGQKAPVFARIAAAVQSLVEATEQTSAQALLELSTLVNAVLYTQGETGISGKLQPIQTAELDLPTSGTSARVLKPLIEALTSTGSGRFEIVRDAFQRGAFRDIRLVNPALKALGDNYGELADLVADEILPAFGRSIYPELKSAFDQKGKGADVRRLRLLHQLDPEATLPLVRDALENGSKEVRVAAISCLNHSMEELPLVLEQAKSKNKEVRSAALQAMAAFPADDVVDVLISALSGKDLDIAVGPASQNTSPRLLQFVLDHARQQRDAILGTTEKNRGKGKLAAFRSFLGCFIGRDDRASVDFLIETFGLREELAKARDTDCGGEDLNRLVALLLVASDAKSALQTLTDVYQELDASLLTYAFAAAAKTCSSDRLYAMFSPFLLAEGAKGKRKRNDPVEDKREAVRWSLLQAAQENPDDSYRYLRRRHRLQTFLVEELEMGDVIRSVQLSPKWLDAAVQSESSELIHLLAASGHKPVLAWLSATLNRLLQQRDVHWEVAQVLQTMNRIQHPDIVPGYMKTVERFLLKKTNSHYYVYWLGRLIPDLPAAALPPLEALIPKLSDRAADLIVGYVAELKRKHGALETS